MAHALYADQALVGDTMVSDVTLTVDDGWITSITPGRAPNSETAGGIVLPGMPDVHSHAFQRAMAGLAERAGPEGDSFWSWREVMYRFLQRLGPEDVEAVATQLYVELLLHGYTTVGEFHYLHTDPAGGLYADPAELAHRIVAAARASGIGLTLLPVLYQTSQFGGAAPTQGQRRFVLSLDQFSNLYQRLQAGYGEDANIRLGVAPHSLRAVPPDALAAVIKLTDGPIHIHAAEQVKEVADSVAWSGLRPVDWLLQHHALDQRWCLIHATHLTDDETRHLAKSGATAGLCPTTEANLGDGFFPFLEFLGHGGGFGIGTDSNVSVSPVEELRWLEYLRRLQRQSRNLTETSVGASTGAALVRAALQGGATALGRPIGALAPGKRADLIVLDAEHPILTSRSGNLALDSWVFSGNQTTVRHVMVGGRWVVRDGRHPDQDTIAARYRQTIARLMA